MIDYFIKINYILSFQRYEKIKRLSPEDTCLVFTDLEVGNLGILSIYFTSGLLHEFNLLGNKTAMYLCLAVLILFFFWAHFEINKKILKSPIRKTIKKLSEKDKKKYSRLAVLYFILSILLWVLAFTWPVILHGSAAMVTPQ